MDMFYILLDDFVIPMVSLYFFCRFCMVKYRWYHGGIYAVVSFGVVNLPLIKPMYGIFFLLIEILILALFGTLFMKCDKVQSFTLASIIITVWNLTNGISSILYVLIEQEYGGGSETIRMFLDIGSGMLDILLFSLFLYSILKVFHGSIGVLHHRVMLLLAIPIVFIALSEQIAVLAIFGDMVIMDKKEGMIFSVVNSWEILVLHLFACMGLVSILAAYDKLMKAIQAEQTVTLLEQQACEKESYVREAQTRYDQTRSFRHDIKNHLLVLGGLLKQEKNEEAYRYLSGLEDVTNALSYPCHTGNVVVDTLLSSKFAIASQKGIDIICTANIPKVSRIEDIDWCIILSNGIDNVINASEEMEVEDRYIHIYGKQKGNFYLLNIENRCKETQKTVQKGIGLWNIQAVVEKYEGTLDIEIANGVFKLNMLFVISQ